MINKVIATTGVSGFSRLGLEPGVFDAVIAAGNQLHDETFLVSCVQKIHEKDPELIETIITASVCGQSVDATLVSWRPEVIPFINEWVPELLVGALNNDDSALLRFENKLGELPAAFFVAQTDYRSANVMAKAGLLKLDWPSSVFLEVLKEELLGSRFALSIAASYQGIHQQELCKNLRLAYIARYAIKGVEAHQDIYGHVADTRARILGLVTTLKDVDSQYSAYKIM